MNVNTSFPGPAAAVRPGDSVLHPLRLAIFCMVAERQSFTRAADELFLSQPTISAHMRSLEQACGARLFDRGRRGAHLTEAGRVVYDYAVDVLRGTAAMHARLRDLVGGEGGVVTLGATLVQGTYVLPGLLADFHLQHPTAELFLRVLPPDVITEDVLGGRLDFGIVSEVTQLPHTLGAEPLWAEEIVVVVRAGHRLASRPSVSIADLAAEPFVGGPPLGARRSVGDQALDAALTRAGFPGRRIIMAIGHPEGTKTAVLKGVGIAVILRRVVAAELAAGQLVALPVAGLPRFERFRLIYRRQHRFSPLAQNLLECLRAYARALADPAGSEATARS